MRRRQLRKHREEQAKQAAQTADTDTSTSNRGAPTSRGATGTTKGKQARNPSTSRRRRSEDDLPGSPQRKVKRRHSSSLQAPPSKILDNTPPRYQRARLPTSDMMQETTRRVQALLSQNPLLNSQLTPRTLDEASERLKQEGLTNINSTVLQRSRRLSSSTSGCGDVSPVPSQVVSDESTTLSGGESLISSTGDSPDDLQQMADVASGLESLSQAAATHGNTCSDEDDTRRLAGSTTSWLSAQSGTITPPNVENQLERSDGMSTLTACALQHLRLVSMTSDA